MTKIPCDCYWPCRQPDRLAWGLQAQWHCCPCGHLQPAQQQWLSGTAASIRYWSRWQQQVQQPATAVNPCCKHLWRPPQEPHSLAGKHTGPCWCNNCRCGITHIGGTGSHTYLRLGLVAFDVQDHTPLRWSTHF